MARIAGVNIPTNKRVLIALQYIHGIGPSKAKAATSAKAKPRGRAATGRAAKAARRSPARQKGVRKTRRKTINKAGRRG